MFYLTIVIIQMTFNKMVWFMVFNATFHNISVISWRSILLVEETGVLWENHRPAASHWQTLRHYVVSSTPPSKSNYHAITTTAAPVQQEDQATASINKWPIFYWRFLILNPIKEGNVIELNQCFLKNQKPSKNRSVKKIEKDVRKES